MFFILIIVYINYSLYDNITTMSIMDGLGLLRCICDEMRFSILEQLSRGDMTVSQIVQTVGRDQPLVSHHLRILKECGIISSKNRGRNVVYSMSSKRLSALIVQIQEAGDEMNNICDDMCCAK